MSSEVFLSGHVHAVRIGDDLVFLDVAADRYLCWPGAQGLVLSEDRRRLAVCDAAALSDLQLAGLVSLQKEVASAQAVALDPAHDLWPGQTTRSERGDGWNLLRASADAAWTYPRQSFAELVAFGASRAPDAAPDREPGPEMMRIVEGFHRWSLWTPAPAKCLIRSFMLLRLLRRRGLDARWVFAVRTWPFEAHCWLQAGATVLDDACSRLIAYHPILVI